MYRAPGGPWDREKTSRRLRSRRLTRNSAWTAALGQPERCGTCSLRRRQESDHTWLGIHRQPVSELHDRRLPLRSRSLLRLEGRRVGPGVDRRKFPVSLKLGIVAIIFSVTVGVPLGVIAALRQNTWLDYLAWGHRRWASRCRPSSAAPPPPLFQSHLLLLSDPRSRGMGRIRSRLFPAGDRPRAGHDGLHRPPDPNQHARIKRQDYVRTARAKGLAEQQGHRRTCCATR